MLIISHNINDVFEVADRIAVLYLGRMAAVRRTADVDRQIVVDLITTGRHATGPTPERSCSVSGRRRGERGASKPDLRHAPELSP